MALYTKTGDAGTTALIGGHRVPKYDPRVEAYGTVDELNAHMALLGDMLHRRTAGSELLAPLRDIVRMLMNVQAVLASDESAADKIADLTESDIEALEHQIDAMSAALPPISNFTIPGGDVLLSQCHVCRTVCRRAERRAVEAADQFPMSAAGAIKYLNRLSDWLYIFGRTIVKTYGVQEILWQPSEKF